VISKRAVFICKTNQICLVTIIHDDERLNAPSKVRDEVRISTLTSPVPTGGPGYPSTSRKRTKKFFEKE
jgi:hypothetical protein